MKKDSYVVFLIKYFSVAIVWNNLANLITLSGLITTIWAISLLCRKSDPVFACFLIQFSIFTDWFDGKIARHYKIQTWVGAKLDQIKDKMMVVSLAFFMLKDIYSSPSAFTVPLITMTGFIATTEIIAFALGFYAVIRKIPVQSIVWGKRKMFAECVMIEAWAFSSLLPLPEFIRFGSWPINLLLTLIAFSVLFLAIKSGDDYRKEYNKQVNKKKETSN